MDNGYQAWNWRWAKLLLQEWHKSRFPWHGHHVVLYFCTFAIGIFCSFFKSDYFFLNSRGYQFSILFPYLDWYIECFYFSSLIAFVCRCLTIFIIFSWTFLDPIFWIHTGARLIFWSNNWIWIKMWILPFLRYFEGKIWILCAKIQKYIFVTNIGLLP